MKAVFILGELVGRIADGLWAGNDLSHFWPNQVSISRVRNYLERCIEKEIRKTVYLATYLLWLQNQNEPYLGRNILMVPVNLWGKEIESYMRALGLEIHVFEDRSDNFMVRLIRIIKFLVNMLGSTIRNILGTKDARNGISQKDKFSDNNRYRVSVPYRRSINPEERNDLFWYEKSEFDPEIINISLESPAYAFDKSDLKLLHSQGFKGVVLGNKDADLTGSLPIWRNTKRMIIMDIKRFWFAMKTVLFAWANWESFWQWSRLVKLMKKVNFLQAYYESENIRVDIGLDPVDSSVIRALAMDNIGGVRIGPQWSSVELLSSFLSKNDNIYFCWGKIEEKFLSKARSCIDTLIISGYIMNLGI